MDQNTLNITSVDLRESLHLVTGIVPANPSQTAHSGVQLVARDEIMTLTASDGDTTIVSQVRIVGDANISAILQPRPLLNLVTKTDSADIITISQTNENDLAVSVNNNTPYKFKTILTTFPSLSSPTDIIYNIADVDLQSALKILKNSLQKEDPVISIVKTKDKISLSSTDSYTLAYIEKNDKSDVEFDILVPYYAFEKAVKINAKELRMDINRRVVTFASEFSQITTRLNSNPYPPVGSIVGNIPESRIDIKTSNPLKVLNRLSALAFETPVKVQMTESVINFSIDNADVGTGSEKCTIQDIVKEDFTFYVKSQYLMSALSIGETVTMRYSGPLQPLHFIVEGNTKSVLIIMPVRV